MRQCVRTDIEIRILQPGANVLPRHVNLPSGVLVARMRQLLLAKLRRKKHSCRDCAGIVCQYWLVSSVILKTPNRRGAQFLEKDVELCPELSSRPE